MLLCSPVRQTWRVAYIHKTAKTLFRVPPTKNNHTNINSKAYEIILIMKPNRCTNFSNLFLEQNSTYFGQFLCPSPGVFHCTHSNGICHTGLLTASSQAVSKPVWLIPLLCVQWKTPGDGQRNCLNHVEFYSKNKFEKLVQLVNFIIRIFHDARSPERQIRSMKLYSYNLT